MHRILNVAVSFLYPRRCPICDRILNKNEKLICAGCIGKTIVNTGPACKKCGRPLARSKNAYCYRCRSVKFDFIGGFAPCAYQGVVQSSLLRFKYSGRAEYARFFAKLMYTFGKEKIDLWAPEVLLPVPVHPSRLRKRGYNQAKLLADALGELTNIPVDDKLLYRRKKTAAQKKLDPAQREQNIKGAFGCRSSEQAYTSVMIVDDIFTTGSTVEEIARVLKKEGIPRIFFAAAAAALFSEGAGDAQIFSEEDAGFYRQKSSPGYLPEGM